MKLLITPLIDLFQEQAIGPDALESLFNALRTASVRKNSQAIELRDNLSVRSQIESALDTIDITTLLNPMMPNTGGMEVLAKLKRELTLEIEATLFAQQH